MSSNEKFSVFMSYVKLFAFLAVAGFGGWYYYQNVYLKRPIATKTIVADDGTTMVVPVEPIPVQDQKPSTVLGPVLATNLAVLTGDFSEMPVELLPNFAPVADAAIRGKATVGKLQTAWTLADQICREMEAARLARNTAGVNLAAQMKVRTVGSNSAPASKTQLAEEVKKREFFQKSAVQRWDLAMAARKKRIDALYAQLQAVEAKTGG